MSESPHQLYVLSRSKCQALTQKSCPATTPNINGQVVFRRKDLMTLWQLGPNKREGPLSTWILYCLLHLTSRLIWSFVLGLMKECLLSQLLQLTSAPLALFSPISWKLIYNPTPEHCSYTWKQNNLLKAHCFMYTQKIPEHGKLLNVHFTALLRRFFGKGTLKWEKL